MKRARRLKSNRFLPAYVTVFADRHGKERLRFRRQGFVSGYFKAALGTEEFRTEYARFMDPEASRDAIKAEVAARLTPGSIGELEARYFAVPERLGPTAVTQGKIRAVIESFCEGRRERMVRNVTFEHLDGIIAKRRAKSGTGNKTKGGIESARKLRKELVRFFDFAVKLRMRTDNPAAHTEPVRVAAGERSKGYHAVTEEEIARYRARHALGTRARLALELYLWTGARRGEGRLLGRQSIKDGRIYVDQGKTGKSGWIAVAPQLLEAIVALPPAPGAMCFLLTERGLPFSPAGLGNKMREWFDQAGLPHCSAHGLRKAIMRRMAELGETNQGMKSVSLHTKDDEVARYTADANQVRMADQAIRKIADWETAMSNRVSGLDVSTAM